MGNVVNVSGSLKLIKAKLQRVKQATANRQTEGYRIFQHREKWRYNAVEDDGACPTCNSLHGEVFRGDYLPVDFPNYEVVSAFEVRIHGDTVFHHRESCRCTAQWLNRHEAVLSVVHEEIAAVVT